MVLTSTLTNFSASRLFRVLVITGAACLVTACASGGGHISSNGSSWGAPKYGKAGQAANHNKSANAGQVARQNNRNAKGGHQKIGRPYVIFGKTYVPARDDTYDRVGVGSWYGPKFHGKKTANGETFDQNAMTAAHPTLPLPSVVRVTNLKTGKQILVRVNDRGPFASDRIIDLSKRAADEIGYKNLGVAKVRVEYIGPAPLYGEKLPITRASAPAKPVSAPITNNNVWLESPKKNHRIALSRPRVAASGWFVQAGAYSNHSRAKQVAAAMHVGRSPMVQTAYVSNQTIYRVLLGPFAAKEQAQEQHTKVVAAGFSKARITKQN
ncbi:MAG: septal ring lytic transglycosylase RlpA family protein [Robiginitomaculum sp.]|nr:septal ring lytic transglycosylase RlpA family protein [Robiginitomaculum sp.]